MVRLSLTTAGRASVDRADAACAAWLGPPLEQTGEPATGLRALDLLDAAATTQHQAWHGTGTGRTNHEHAQ